MDGEQELHRTREAVLVRCRGRSGRLAAHDRRRLVAPGGGVRARAGSAPDVPPLDSGELERRRAASGLGEFVPRLTETLSSVIDAGQMVVVADAEGRVLWRAGSSGVRRMADGLGFIGGSAWTEGNVGTNAIGTSLVLGEGVHIQGPGALRRVPHPLGLRRRPAHGPVVGPHARRRRRQRSLAGHAPRRARAGRDGRPADLDGARRASPGRARPAAGHGRPAARADQRRRPGRRRRRAPRGRRRARAPDRVALPDDIAGGPVWLPTSGAAYAEPLAGGWLLRLDGEADGRPTALVARPHRRARACAWPGRAGPGRGASRRGTPRSWSPSSRPVPRAARPTGLALDLFDDPRAGGDRARRDVPPAPGAGQRAALRSLPDRPRGPRRGRAARRPAAVAPRLQRARRAPPQDQPGTAQR